MQYFTGTFIEDSEHKIRETICERFDIVKAELDAYDLILAFISYPAYEGYALLILKSRKDSGLYMVEGAHCSCSDFEGQFEPKRVNSGMLRTWIDENMTYGVGLGEGEPLWNDANDASVMKDYLEATFS